MSIPVTEEIRDVLNTALFAQLPDDAYLINIARGELLSSQTYFTAWRGHRLCLFRCVRKSYSRMVLFGRILVSP